MIGSRPIKNFSYTPHYERAHKRLPSHIKEFVKKREQWFRANAFDTRLDTHKLKGQFSKFWSFSITRSYRIVFTFENGDEVVFHDAGDHRVYQ